MVDGVTATQRTLGPVLDRVVVVGGSLAGLRACEVLRSSGYDGTITLIGAEARRPYDRPPLSKQFLAGAWDEDRIALRKDDAFDALASTPDSASRRQPSTSTPVRSAWPTGRTCRSTG